MKWIRDRYAVRIVKILQEIRNQLMEAGYFCGDIWEDNGDQYRWDFLCHTKGEPKKENPFLNDEYDIDISFTIATSEEHDGSKGGVNFTIDIVAVGGAIIGGLTPYNYSDKVWVRRGDRQAVLERFKMMQDVDADCVPLIKQYLENKAQRKPH